MMKPVQVASKLFIGMTTFIFFCASQALAQDDEIRLNTSPTMKEVQTVFVLPGNKEDCSGRRQDSEDFAQYASVNFGAMYSVVERQYLMQILEEQEFNMSGLFSEADVVQAGRLHGAQGIIFCDVGCLRGKSFITMKLVDCENGAQQWGASAFRADFRDFLDEVISELNSNSSTNVKSAKSSKTLIETDVVLSGNTMNRDKWNCGNPVAYYGHNYKTEAAGGECWFSDNLQVSFYRNGDPISSPEKLKDWDVYDEGYYLDPNSNAGFLYNTPAILDERLLCPTGWHIPSRAEWESIFDMYGISLSDGEIHLDLGIDLFETLPGIVVMKTQLGAVNQGSMGEWAMSPDEGTVGFEKRNGDIEGEWIRSIQLAKQEELTLNPMEVCIGCSVRCVMD